MALHKANAQFARAQWRITILAPIWASQLLLTMTMMGLFAYRFGYTMKHHDEKLQAGGTPTVEYAWEVTNIVMSLVASLCTFVDVARYYTESLTPWTMLFTHVIKATCALAILALDITVYILLSEEKYSLVGIGLDAALILLTGAMAMYAILAYRRLSAYDDYAHPANVKGYGFSDYSTSSRPEYLSANSHGSGNSGRLSVGSMNEPLSLDVLDTTAPYDHQRNTQFEEYMAKRSSSNSHGDVESGSTGRGLDDSPPQVHSPTTFSPQGLSPAPIRSPLSPQSPDVPVTTGQVHALQRGPSIARITSWASDHVLVAVPEEEAELEHHMADDVSLLSPDAHEMPGFDGPRANQSADVPEPRWK